MTLAVAGLVTLCLGQFGEGAVTSALTLMGTAAPRWSASDHLKLHLVLLLYGSALLAFSFMLLPQLRRGQVGAWVARLGVAALTIGLVLGFRAGSGIGLGHQALASDMVASGIIFNPTDNLSYLSWSKQAQEGAFLFRNLYTTTPHEPAAVNAYLWAVGAFARVARTELAFTYHALGLLGAAVAVIATYSCALVFRLGHRVAWWATVLLSFASGLSLPARIGAAVLGRPEPSAADVEFADSFGFTILFGYPYHAAMLATVALLILLVGWAERDMVVTGQPKGLQLAPIAMMSMFLAASRPYDSVMLAGSYTLFALVAAVGRRHRLLVVAALWGGAALPLGWTLYVARLPVWSQFVQSSVIQGRDRMFWALGFGVLLPLALWGAYRVIRHTRSAPVGWLVAWAIPVLAALVLLGLPFSKMSSGLPIPLSLLAAVGTVRGVKSLRVSLRRGHTVLAPVAGAAVAVLLFGTPFYLMVEWIGPHSIPAEITRIAAELERAARPVRVLAPPEVAEVVVPLAGASVFLGHWSLTPDHLEKLARLEAAGVLGGRDGPNQRSEMESLIRECRCTHVVVASQPSTEDGVDLPGSTLVGGDWPGWIVVELESAGGDGSR